MCKTWGTIRIRIDIKMQSGIRIGIKTKPIHEIAHCMLSTFPNALDEYIVSQLFLTEGLMCTGITDQPKD
jgi:hypothetical protein